MQFVQRFIVRRRRGPRHVWVAQVGSCFPVDNPRAELPGSCMKRWLPSLQPGFVNPGGAAGCRNGLGYLCARAHESYGFRYQEVGSAQYKHGSSILLARQRNDRHTSKEQCLTLQELRNRSNRDNCRDEVSVTVSRGILRRVLAALVLGVWLRYWGHVRCPTCVCLPFSATYLLIGWLGLLVFVRCCLSGVADCFLIGGLPAESLCYVCFLNLHCTVIS